jgi:carbon starvation protein
MGAVHDFGALVISIRHRGRSICEISKWLVNREVRTLLFLVIFFALMIVIAIFCLVIAIIFNQYPQAMFPVWLEVPLAVMLGYRFYRGSASHRGARILFWSVVALIIMYVSIYIGIFIPIRIPSIWGVPSLTMWVIILLGYSYIASILPVWSLLQPRDYINAHELILALILLLIGVAVAHPVITAPKVNLDVTGAPQFIPFLFITIACGAISGFHSLVGSGTSAKQLDNEANARFIGYGGMMAEAALAIIVIVCCTAGLGSVGAWTERYGSWHAASGLVAKVSAFVDGGSTFLIALGIPRQFALGILGVFVASFAGTTLDTATRIQRYVIAELAHDYGVKPLSNRYGATLFAVVTAGILAFAQGGGKGALILWPLFGTVNQLLAGIAFLLITAYLIRKKLPSLYTMIPMAFMLTITLWALALNLRDYVQQRHWHLAVIGTCVLALAVWIVVQTVKVLVKRGE